MQEEIADLVYPVLLGGLRLRERLERGEPLDFQVEQAVLRRLLLTESEARRWPEFGGDDPAAPRNGGYAPTEPGTEAFLGVRYGLTCWLDELFILDSPWHARWNEHKLEMALYGTNDRAWKFWDQAQRAEKRPDSDALEAYFLCAMLGFRGTLAQEPGKLQAWVAAARAHVGRGQGQLWPYPPELEPGTHVPPLRGRARLQRVVLVGGVLLLVLIPFVAYFLIDQFGR